MAAEVGLLVLHLVVVLVRDLLLHIVDLGLHFDLLERDMVIFGGNEHHYLPPLHIIYPAIYKF